MRSGNGSKCGWEGGGVCVGLEFWAKVVSKLDLTEERVSDNDSICGWVGVGGLADRL